MEDIKFIINHESNPEKVIALAFAPSFCIPIPSE